MILFQPSLCYVQKQSLSISSLNGFIYNKFQIQKSKYLKTVLTPIYESVRAEIEFDDIKID